MIALFDTNVILDVVLARHPHAAPASLLFAAVENGALQGTACATSITTLHYLAEKAVGRARARTEIGRLLTLFDVAPVTRLVLDSALAAKRFADFEDAVVHEAARHAGAQCIVTRNTRDFAAATLQVFLPVDLLKALRSHREP